MPPPVPRVLLCIDDRPHLLRLRETLLGKHGYVVVAATTAGAAIAKLENYAPEKKTTSRAVGALSHSMPRGLRAASQKTPHPHAVRECRRMSSTSGRFQLDKVFQVRWYSQKKKHKLTFDEHIRRGLERQSAAPR
jgi:CheY-like chemotaxis protein